MKSGLRLLDLRLPPLENDMAEPTEDGNCILPVERSQSSPICSQPQLISIRCLHLLPLPLPHTKSGEKRPFWLMCSLTAVLSAWGYQEKHPVKLTACIAYLLLRNRSPYLEMLTDELLETVNQTCIISSVRDRLYQVSRALAALGL